MKTNLTVTLKTWHLRLLAALLVVTPTMLPAQASTAAAVTFAKGTYNGLFSQGSGTNLVVDHPFSGFLTVRASDSGAFSGAIFTSPTTNSPAST